MPMHVSLYLCVHCGSVYNSFAECQQHEGEAHGDDAPLNILASIRNMCSLAMTRGDQAPTNMAMADVPNGAHDILSERSTTDGSPDDDDPPPEATDTAIFQPLQPKLDVSERGEHLPCSFGDGIVMAVDETMAPSSSIRETAVRQSKVHMQNGYARRHPVVRCEHCNLLVSVINRRRHERLHTG